MNSISLPYLGANPSTITSSGFSSGSYMSAHLHVIMSDTIKGVGLMNGGAYWSIPAWNDKDDYYALGAKQMS